MRTLIVLVLLSFTTINNLSAQQTLRRWKVPKAVKKAYHAKFEGIKPSGWARDGEVYEVKFFKDGKKQRASFDENGKWQSTSWSMNAADLPRAVTMALGTTDYGKWTVAGVRQMETPTQKLLYRVRFKKGKQAVKIYVTPDGKITKKVKEKAPEKSPEKK